MEARGHPTDRRHAILSSVSVSFERLLSISSDKKGSSLSGAYSVSENDTLRVNALL